MNAWMAGALGEYAYRFLTIAPDQIQFALAACFFCRGLRHRRLYGLRVFFSILYTVAFLALAAWARTVAANARV